MAVSNIQYRGGLTSWNGKKKKKKSFIIDLLGLRSFYKSFKSFKLVNIGATHLTTLSHATKMIEISQQTFVFRKKT